MELRAASAGRLLAPPAVLVPVLATPVVAISSLAPGRPWAVLALAFLAAGTWALRSYRLTPGICEA
jgi:hypothetical protein